MKNMKNIIAFGVTLFSVLIVCSCSDEKITCNCIDVPDENDSSEVVVGPVNMLINK